MPHSKNTKPIGNIKKYCKEIEKHRYSYAYYIACITWHDRHVDHKSGRRKEKHIHRYIKDEQFNLPICLECNEMIDFDNCLKHYTRIIDTKRIKFKEQQAIYQRDIKMFYHNFHNALCDDEHFLRLSVNLETKFSNLKTKFSKFQDPSIQNKQGDYKKAFEILYDDGRFALQDQFHQCCIDSVEKTFDYNSISFFTLIKERGRVIDYHGKEIYKKALGYINWLNSFCENGKKVNEPSEAYGPSIDVKYNMNYV